MRNDQIINQLSKDKFRSDHTLRFRKSQNLPEPEHLYLKNDSRSKRVSSLKQTRGQSDLHPECGPTGQTQIRRVPQDRQQHRVLPRKRREDPKRIKGQSEAVWNIYSKENWKHWSHSLTFSLPILMKHHLIRVVGDPLSFGSCLSHHTHCCSFGSKSSMRLLCLKVSPVFLPLTNRPGDHTLRIESITILPHGLPTTI